MKVEADILYGELRCLCRRGGVRGRNLRDRIGLDLQRVFGVTELDTDAAIREKAAGKIDEFIDKFPVEDQRDIRVVLGMHPEAYSANVERRLDWLVRETHRSMRTIERTCAELLRVLANDIVATERAAAIADEIGYVVDIFDAKIIFTRRRATIRERRKIRAVRRLTEICCRYGSRRLAAGEQPDADIRVVHGGRLIEWTRQNAGEGDAIAYRIEPLEPIEEGRTYEFEVEYRYPNGIPMPHYVLQPITVFGFFGIEPRFDPADPPSRVWRVDGLGHREVDICPGEEQLVTVDSAGRIGELVFNRFYRGGSYGAAWTWM